MVVGCNRGYECRAFKEMGASEVFGVDVIDEIGAEFDGATYFKTSAEELPFDDETFDFIFCSSTMEHIPDIYMAYKELQRVSKSKGLIYCVAAPLWNSRHGPHWGDVFNKETPWMHLWMDLKKIIKTGASKGFPEAQIRNFVGGDNCNKRWLKDYFAATKLLDKVDVIRNSVDLEEIAKCEISDRLRACGYSDEELFGLTHTFIAKKK